MLNGHEIISDCPHYAFCTHVLYVGSCMKECFERRRKECGTSPAKAKWKHRAEHNDYIWCECSNCSFRVEAYKAVISEGRDTNYVGVKYKFCPICGKPMEV